MTTEDLLEELYRTFCTGIRSRKASKPKSYLGERGLDYDVLNIGFNSGQFHHRKSDAFKKDYIRIGVLYKRKEKGRKPGLITYTCFGSYGIIFPLRNAQNRISNFYSIRIKTNPERREYLYPQGGLYPVFPSIQTTRLFLTIDVLSTATLLQSKILFNRDAVLSLNEGEFTADHFSAIAGLTQLKEIILLSEKNTDAQQQLLSERCPLVQLSQTAVPDGETLNDFFYKYGASGMLTLVGENKTDNELPLSSTKKEIISSDNQQINDAEEQIPTLDNSEPNKLSYSAERAIYTAVGELSSELGSMPVTLCFRVKENQKEEFRKLDLYDRVQVEEFSTFISERHGLSYAETEADLGRFASLLSKYRDTHIQEQAPNRILRRQIPVLSPARKDLCIQFLSEANLFNRINRLLGQSGIVAEENNRKLLFLVASTYKADDALHAIVQGTSGSGKTHLINSVAKCCPQEDVLFFSTLTDKTLHNFERDALVNKLVVLQDYDGIDEKAVFALRELQSAGRLDASTVTKDKSGNISSKMHTVNAHFSSMMATTHGEIKFDNASRSIICGIDESDETTKRIVEYNNQKDAGIISPRQEKEARDFLADCIRSLRSIEVVNPYAGKIHLPVQGQVLRRLSKHFNVFVKQITFLYQYQRKQDAEGRLITHLQDVKTACDLFADAFLSKGDELESPLRIFFEKMKKYLSKNEKGKDALFTRKEIRQKLNISNGQLQRYIDKLEELEYIRIAEGHKNTGFKYRIEQWDDYTGKKSQLKFRLNEQLAKLK